MCPLDTVLDMVVFTHTGACLHAFGHSRQDKLSVTFSSSSLETKSRRDASLIPYSCNMRLYRTRLVPNKLKTIHVRHLRPFP